MMKQTITYKAGLDIGSTTAKIVLLDQDGTLLFSDYQRHHAKICETLISFFNRLTPFYSNCFFDLKLTGSASLSIAKRMSLPFVQEVIATNVLIRKKYNQVSTVMDIGGEDSKVIFLDKDSLPDIRMNGSCAGGTGSFIDQMASLLNITPFQLNELAESCEQIYPVASRCGVFAKTDVQNMFSRNIAHNDIAGSIFHAVAVQCINTLARGVQIRPKMVLCGGVFTFLPGLVTMFKKILKFSDTDIILPERSELIPAWGGCNI